MPVKIFFCYAHEDELLLNNLKKHLWPLQQQKLIDIWHDRDISAGTEWVQEIDSHLSSAQIILLLISADFLASEYCSSIEMQQALERHERGEARVIPIILRPVYWQGTLGKLQALPRDGKPATGSDWHNLDTALYDITDGIRKAVEQWSVQHASVPLKVEKETQQRSVEKSTLPRTSKGELQRLDFWSKFKEFALNKSTKLKLPEPRSKAWCDISVGSSKAHIALTISTQKALMACELNIPNSKELFKTLYADREKIEAELGEQLDWMELPPKIASKIKITRKAGTDDPAKWEEYFAWLLEEAEKFHKVFAKLI